MSTFYGTPGNDVISAADVGADTIFGRGGDDEIYAPRPDDIDDSATYFLDGGDGHDFIYGQGIFVEARGGGGNDRFELGGESVTVRGGAGDDEVRVGANGGSVYGGDGNDIIHATIFPYHALIDGGAGDDILNIRKGASSEADYPAVAIGGLGRDRITALDDGIDARGGDGADELVGSDDAERGADLLYGNRGDDRIWGRAGDDKIGGGYGVDTMSGGGGEDLFDVNAGDSGVGAGRRDVITDFLPGADHIDVTSIDARVGVAGDQAFRFIGTDPFTAAGQLRFFHAGGDTIVQVSVDGDRQPEGELQLAGVLDLAGRDFLL